MKHNILFKAVTCFLVEETGFNVAVKSCTVGS